MNITSVIHSPDVSMPTYRETKMHGQFPSLRLSSTIVAGANEHLGTSDLANCCYATALTVFCCQCTLEWRCLAEGQNISFLDRQCLYPRSDGSTDRDGRRFEIVNARMLQLVLPEE
jgi:hypothetical protein